MARGLSVDIDATSLQAMAAELGASESQVEAAMRSTYGKVARWARTRATRALASRLGVRQKIIRRRVLTYRMQSGVSEFGRGAAKVWFGTRPIKVRHLNPRARRKGGVSAAGGRHYPHGFLIGDGKSARAFERVGPQRYPLRELEVPISDDVENYIEDALIGSPEFEAEFFKIFERELRWRTR